MLDWAARKALRYFLQKSVGTFLQEEIELDSMDVRVLNGVVELRHLRLNCEKINGMPGMNALPLELEEGLVGSMRLRLPWWTPGRPSGPDGAPPSPEAPAPDLGTRAEVAEVYLSARYRQDKVEGACTTGEASAAPAPPEGPAASAAPGTLEATRATLASWVAGAGAAAAGATPAEPSSFDGVRQGVRALASRLESFLREASVLVTRVKVRVAMPDGLPAVVIDVGALELPPGETRAGGSVGGPAFLRSLDVRGVVLSLERHAAAQEEPAGTEPGPGPAVPIPAASSASADDLEEVRSIPSILTTMALEVEMEDRGSAIDSPEPESLSDVPAPDPMVHFEREREGSFSTAGKRKGGKKGRPPRSPAPLTAAALSAGLVAKRSMLRSSSVASMGGASSAEGTVRLGSADGWESPGSLLAGALLTGRTPRDASPAPDGPQHEEEAMPALSGLGLGRLSRDESPSVPDLQHTTIDAVSSPTPSLRPTSPSQAHETAGTSAPSDPASPRTLPCLDGFPSFAPDTRVSPAVSPRDPGTPSEAPGPDDAPGPRCPSPEREDSPSRGPLGRLWSYLFPEDGESEVIDECQLVRCAAAKGEAVEARLQRALGEPEVPLRTLVGPVTARLELRGVVSPSGACASVHASIGHVAVAVTAADLQDLRAIAAAVTPAKARGREGAPPRAASSPTHPAAASAAPASPAAHPLLRILSGLEGRMAGSIEDLIGSAMLDRPPLSPRGSDVSDASVDGSIYFDATDFESAASSLVMSLAFSSHAAPPSSSPALAAAAAAAFGSSRPAAPEAPLPVDSPHAGPSVTFSLEGLSLSLPLVTGATPPITPHPSEAHLASPSPLSTSALSSPQPALEIVVSDLYLALRRDPYPIAARLGSLSAHVAGHPPMRGTTADEPRALGSVLAGGLAAGSVHVDPAWTAKLDHSKGLIPVLLWGRHGSPAASVQVAPVGLTPLTTRTAVRAHLGPLMAVLHPGALARIAVALDAGAAEDAAGTVPAAPYSPSSSPAATPALDAEVSFESLQAVACGRSATSFVIANMAGSESRPAAELSLSLFPSGTGRLPDASAGPRPGSEFFCSCRLGLTTMSMSTSGPEEEPSFWDWAQLMTIGPSGDQPGPPRSVVELDVLPGALGRGALSAMSEAWVGRDSVGAAEVATASSRCPLKVALRGWSFIMTPSLAMLQSGPGEGPLASLAALGLELAQSLVNPRAPPRPPLPPLSVSIQAEASIVLPAASRPFRLRLGSTQVTMLLSPPSRAARAGEGLPQPPESRGPILALVSCPSPIQVVQEGCDIPLVSCAPGTPQGLWLGAWLPGTATAAGGKGPLVSAELDGLVVANRPGQFHLEWTEDLAAVFAVPDRPSASIPKSDPASSPAASPGAAARSDSQRTTVSIVVRRSCVVAAWPNSRKGSSHSGLVLGVDAVRVEGALIRGAPTASSAPPPAAGPSGRGDADEEGWGDLGASTARPTPPMDPATWRASATGIRCVLVDPGADDSASGSGRGAERIQGLRAALWGDVLPSAGRKPGPALVGEERVVVEWRQGRSVGADVEPWKLSLRNSCLFISADRSTLEAVSVLQTALAEAAAQRPKPAPKANNGAAASGAHVDGSGPTSPSPHAVLDVDQLPERQDLGGSGGAAGPSQAAEAVREALRASPRGPSNPAAPPTPHEPASTRELECGRWIGVAPALDDLDADGWATSLTDDSGAGSDSAPDDDEWEEAIEAPPRGGTPSYTPAGSAGHVPESNGAWLPRGESPTAGPSQQSSRASAPEPQAQPRTAVDPWLRLVDGQTCAGVLELHLHVRLRLLGSTEISHNPLPGAPPSDPSMEDELVMEEGGELELEAAGLTANVWVFRAPALVPWRASVSLADLRFVNLAEPDPASRWRTVLGKLMAGAEQQGALLAKSKRGGASAAAVRAITGPIREALRTPSSSSGGVGASPFPWGGTKSKGGSAGSTAAGAGAPAARSVPSAGTGAGMRARPSVRPVAPAPPPGDFLRLDLYSLAPREAAAPTAPPSEMLLRVSLHPLRIHLDQYVVRFLIGTLGGLGGTAAAGGETTSDEDAAQPKGPASSPVPSPSAPHDASAPADAGAISGGKGSGNSFFRRVEVAGTRIRLDYKPRRADLRRLTTPSAPAAAALEALNLVPVSGLELKMPGAAAVGCSGLAEALVQVGAVQLEYIRRTQAYKFVEGLPALHSATRIARAAKKVIDVPMRSLQHKGAGEADPLDPPPIPGRLMPATLGEAAAGLLRAVASEALGLGVSLTGGAEFVLSGGSVPDRGAPRNVTEGLAAGAERLTRGLEGALVALSSPIFSIQRGEGFSVALARGIRAAPEAVVRPAEAAAAALKAALQGARNAIDADRM